MLSVCWSLFVCCQLITAFEKAMVLIDPVPGEEHRKASADYIKCLSKVSSSSDVCIPLTICSYSIENSLSVSK